jgi:hypothetical protein
MKLNLFRPNLNVYNGFRENRLGQHAHNDSGNILCSIDNDFDMFILHLEATDWQFFWKKQGSSLKDRFETTLTLLRQRV